MNSFYIFLVEIIGFIGECKQLIKVECILMKNDEAFLKRPNKKAFVWGIIDWN